jgi:hypothetical protein
MSRKLIVAGVLCAAIGATVLIAYARSRSTSRSLSQGPVEGGSTAAFANGPEARNLALQPEAFKLKRRIGGDRFTSKTPAAVVMQGILSIGPGHQNVQISRYQTDSGERVEVAQAGAAAPLLWDAAAGAHTAAGVLDLPNRALLERLTFDSADEFILAQLRGASYYVVARNVRPDAAPEDYSGPLWDVVRIDDPEQDQQKKPLSAWRLYYLNSSTGLIDRIVCDSQGDRIEANFSDWTDRSGEKFPSTITWTSSGRTLMSFNLTNVSLITQ